MDDFTMNAMKDTGWASKCGTEGRRWQSGFFSGLVSYMLDSKYVSIYLYTIYDIYIYINTYYIYDYTFVWFRVVFGGFQGLMFFIVNLQIQSWTFVVQAATSWSRSMGTGFRRALIKNILCTSPVDKDCKTHPSHVGRCLFRALLKFCPSKNRAGGLGFQPGLVFFVFPRVGWRGAGSRGVGWKREILGFLHKSDSNRWNSRLLIKILLEQINEMPEFLLNPIENRRIPVIRVRILWKTDEIWDFYWNSLQIAEIRRFLLKFLW